MAIYSDAVGGKPPADFNPLVDRYEVGAFPDGDWSILRILEAHLGPDVAEECRKAAVTKDNRGKGYLSWTLLSGLAKYALADVGITFSIYGWYGPGRGRRSTWPEVVA